MKLEIKRRGWLVGAAWTFALTAPAYGNEISIKNFHKYVTSNLNAADPGVMVLIGVGLIALRVLISRRSKRREQNPAQS